MKRACKQCRVLFDGGSCPLCSNSDFATSWNGRVSIISVEKSLIAKRLGIAKEGDYAIKVR